MWKIAEHKKISKIWQYIPIEIQKRYEKWKDIVRLSGPQGLREIKGFHDEILRGKLFGLRSSRLGIKWMVFYKIDKETIYIHVIDINPHEYN